MEACIDLAIFMIKFYLTIILVNSHHLSAL